jgi:hypothetical protein
VAEAYIDAGSEAKGPTAIATAEPEAGPDGDGDSLPSSPLVVSIVSPPDFTTVEEGAFLDFQGAAAGGTPPYEFVWSFGWMTGNAPETQVADVQVRAAGIHTSTLTVTDAKRETAAAAIQVQALPLEGDMRFWFGNFHSHTGYSDGAGTPAEGFAFARDQANLDFYAVTDHAERLHFGEFRRTGEQADANNMPGQFVALAGFEWSHPLLGHVCVYETESYTSAYFSFLLRLFYVWLDRRGALAQFNHPGRERGVFNGLNLSDKVRDNFFAIEVGNKGTGINDGEFLPYYAQALDNGWRVAPTNNQDNHSLNLNSHRSVFISEELSRESLLEAMEARRIYATDDPTTEIVFRHGDAWMGEEVEPPGETLTFSVKVTADEPIMLLRIVTNGGETAAELIPDEDETKVFWRPEVTGGPNRYFYLEVTETDLHDDDGPVQMAVTAPIWTS